MISLLKMFFYPKVKSLPFDRKKEELEFIPKKEKKRTRILFTKNEDEQLKNLVKEYGDSDWALVAANMEGKTVRQCRERWLNNLSSSVVKSKWSEAEDNILKQKYMIYGPKWKKFEAFFKGRTSYNIRNRWNSISKSKKHLLDDAENSIHHQNKLNDSTNDMKISHSSTKINENFNHKEDNQKLESENNENKETNKIDDISIFNDADIFNDIFSGFLNSYDENIFF